MCGKSGSGKTRNVVMPVVSKIPVQRLYVVDANYEYRNLPAGHRIIPAYYSAEWLDSFILEFRRKHVNCCLVIEDLDMFSPRQSEELIRLSVNCRHQNIGLVLVSRRILGLPKVLVMKVTYMAIFRGLSVEDKDYLTEINPDFETLAFPTEDFKYILIENA